MERFSSCSRSQKRILRFSITDVHGALDGKRITVGNGGRYAPDTAITTEILCGGGANNLIRVGSCGSLQENVQIGDLVIVTGALRGEGTSRYYVPENFSTVARSEIINALKRATDSFKGASITSAGSSPPTRYFRKPRN